MEKINESNDTLVLTYHNSCKLVTCVCGIVIQRCHSCVTVMSSKVQIVECGYKEWDDKVKCWTCLKEKDFQRYLDSSYKDRDGYEYCSFCNEHIHCCSCVVFINKDGEKKCKSSNKIWNGFDVESGGCDMWGYMGD